MNQSATLSDELERWLPVAGFPHYEVSDLGRVRSLPRLARYGSAAWSVPGQMLSPRGGTRTNSRYVVYTLYRNGEKRTVSAHILVARAFLGPPPSGQVVRHGPEGRLDNRLANLSYGTRAENLADRYRDGTMLIGDRAPGAKLTEKIVSQCRARVAAGESVKLMAHEFGVSYGVMWKAVHGATWRHVPAPLRPRPWGQKKAPDARG